MSDLLSIIIPAYNEEKTIEQIVKKVLLVDLPLGYEKEIIIVNDFSKDSTMSIVDRLAKQYSNVSTIHNNINMGKSQSVKRGILVSKGYFVTIQDADLEYDPNELQTLLNKALVNNLDVVYGDRFGKKNKVIYLQNYFGNKCLSFLSNVFTYPKIKVWIPDMEVCYKVINGEVAREIATELTAKSNFGFEPEITAKLAKYKINNLHLKFGICPISYYPRSIAEGKHMKALQDGLKALKEIISYNL